MPSRRSVVRPLTDFLKTESAGGVVLLGATVVALVWANSPWQNSYETVWHSRLAIGTESVALPEDLRHWVNDGLMTLFFFVVGLEIKRELLLGELRERRTAVLPVAAAVGGMVVPAVFYLLLNSSGPNARGWGIPVATDIAFAIGILSISLTPVPASLKAFLLALAIVDDIGAIAIIAMFYSEGISVPWLGAAAGLLLFVLGIQRVGIGWRTIYAVAGVAVWFAIYQSGIHATIAGVALAFVTAARPIRGPLSPLARLETLLHPWTSFAIIPLFALANAGITFSGSLLQDTFSSGVAPGVVLGLVVGKPFGIWFGAWLSTRVRLARLPDDLRWKDVVSVGVIGGVGFTVSLFIANLAFGLTGPGDEARFGIFAGSLLAGTLGWLLLSFWRRDPGNTRRASERRGAGTG